MVGLPSDYNHIAFALQRWSHHLDPQLSVFPDGRNVTCITRARDLGHLRKRKFEPY